MKQVACSKAHVVCCVIPAKAGIFVYLHEIPDQVRDDLLRKSLIHNSICAYYKGTI